MVIVKFCEPMFFRDWDNSGGFPDRGYCGRQVDLAEA